MTVDMKLMLGGKMECVSPLFLGLIILTAIVFIWRLSTHRLVRGEWILITLPALATLLIMVQHLAEGNVGITFWRYHYPAWVTLLIYPACGVASICHRLPLLRYVLPIVVLGFFGNRIRHTLVHAHNPARHTEAAQIAGERWTADCIRADWKGPSRAEFVLNLNSYATTRLPVVFASFPRIAYLCGGRDVQPYRILHGLDPTPDYFLSLNGHLDLWKAFYRDVPLDFVATCRYKNLSFTLYRAMKTKNKGSRRE